MDILFFILFLASVVVLVAGLIKPSHPVFVRFLKERATRKGVAALFVIMAVIFFVLFAVTAKPTEQQLQGGQETPTTQSEGQKVGEQLFDGDEEQTTGEQQESTLKLEQEHVPTPEAKTEPKPQSQKTTFSTITRVVDGDTYDVMLPDGSTDRIRIIGIDTPEIFSSNEPNKFGDITNIQCLDDWGIKASNYAESVLANEQVKLSYDITTGERGFYGRLLAYIEVNGSDFGSMLLEGGYGRAATERDFEKEDIYAFLHNQARQNNVGLWDCVNIEIVEGSTADKWYTSSYYSAQYYYHETCEGWQNLSETYLRSYETEEELLENHDRTLHPECNVE